MKRYPLLDYAMLYCTSELQKEILPLIFIEDGIDDYIRS